jgi:hypothetical protein
MRHLLIEEAHPIITDFLADFCAFACEKLGLTTCPPITFVEHTGNASFGSYSPSEGTVIVATSGRHAADILRTLAHEFVHEQQIKSGSEQTLIEMEYEANAIAGLLMREYNQLHPGLYGVMDSVGVENDTDEHESFGATAADPTRPSGPINMAEAKIQDTDTDKLKMLKLGNQALRAFPSSPRQHAIQKQIEMLRDKMKREGTPEYHTTLNEDAPENADGDEGESMGATFADPTRPSTPVGLAELSNETLASYKRKANAHLRFFDARLWDAKARGEKRHYSGIPFIHNPNLGTKREQSIKTAEDKLRKRYAVNEDVAGAPTNSAGSGEIAGIGIGPQGEPGIKKSSMIRRKPKSALAKIFTGFPKPKKLFKEYKATITKRLSDDVYFSKPLVTPKKNLAFLGLPHKSLKQFLKGR